MLALFLPMIRAELVKLATWGEMGRDHELYAEVFLAELPVIVHQKFSPQQALQYLNHPQWFETISALEPRLAPQREWCDAMRLELIDIIEDQLKNEPESSAVPPQITDPVNGENLGE